MNDDSRFQPSGAGEMQFDRAEFDQTSSKPPGCAICGETLRGHYFDVNGTMTCERCRYEAEAAFNQRGGGGGFFRACFAGLGAAVVGSLLYYAVLAGTGYVFGLIAILVGYGVGYAVRWGSRGKGGWVYQSLAIFLTYMAIVSTYIPMVVKQFGELAEKEKASAAAPAKPGGEVRPTLNEAAPSASAKGAAPEEELTLGGAVLGIGALVLLVMALPFLAGFKNIIGLAIIAFGLFEAWKLNRRTSLSISGPFQLGAAAPASPAGS